MIYVVFCDCVGTSYTTRTYNDALCQFSYVEEIHSTIGSCIDGTRFTCSTSTTKSINYGYLTTSNYYLTSPSACTGDALSTSYSLGVCIPNTKTSSTRYTNYTYFSSTKFTLTVAFYTDNTCSTSLSGYPIVKSYSPVCKTTGTAVKTYYSPDTPSLSVGLFFL